MGPLKSRQCPYWEKALILEKFISQYRQTEERKGNRSCSYVPIFMMQSFCSKQTTRPSASVQNTFRCKLYNRKVIYVCSSITWLPFPSCSTIACSLPLIFEDFMWNHFQKYLRTVLYCAIVPIFLKDYELGLSKTKCLAWKHAQALWYIRKAHGRFSEFQSEL